MLENVYIKQTNRKTSTAARDLLLEGQLEGHLSGRGEVGGAPDIDKHGHTRPGCFFLSFISQMKNKKNKQTKAINVVWRPLRIN